MAKMLKLIERHMVLWDLKRRLTDLGQRPGRCLVNGVAYGPCLLLSRQRGAGGSRVARLVGDQLGWHVFDREILEQIAELAHVRLRLISSVDEQTRGKLEQNGNGELKPENIPEEIYSQYLRQVLLTLAHHGDVVLVGRGANFLVPSPCALRVRIVAPLELRAQRLAERENIPLPQVQEQLATFDAERAAFLQRCFHQDAASSLNYDLVINTGELNLETAAQLVLQGLQHKLGLKNPLFALHARAA